MYEPSSRARRLPFAVLGLLALAALARAAAPVSDGDWPMPARATGQTRPNFVNITVRPSATATIVDFAELATTDTNDASILVTQDFGFTQVGHAGASNIFNSWVVNSPTLAFVVAGQSPELEADVGTSGTIAFSSATLSGYLVDAP